MAETNVKLNMKEEELQAALSFNKDGQGKLKELEGKIEVLEFTSKQQEEKCEKLEEKKVKYAQKKQQLAQCIKQMELHVVTANKKKMKVKNLRKELTTKGENIEELKAQIAAREKVSLILMY